MSALIPAPAAALATLPESARTLAAASLTTNTRRAYSGALARLDSFLAGRPLEDGALAAYLATLRDAGRAPAVAGQAVAAAKLRAKLAGQPSPAGPATDRVLAGFRREARDRGRGQVAGIRWEQADAIGAVAANWGARLPGSAMRQSSPSCPMQCSGFPKSPPSIAPTLPPKRTGPAGSPSGTRKQTKRARAPCSS